MPCAGKDEFAKILARKGFKALGMSSICKEMMEEKKLKIDRESMRTFSTEMRNRYGNGIFAKHMADKIMRMRGKNIAVSGIRGEAEIDELKKRIGKKLITVWIDARAGIRFKRMMKRKRDNDPIDLKGFRKRDRIEASWGLLDVRKHADIIIANEGTIPDLRKSALLLLSKLEK